MYAKNAEYRKKNKRKIKSMKLRYSYGIDVETFEQMLKDQKYKCLIDGQTIDSKTAHVDHNHSNGMVRGLLCDSCNKGLGFFKDNVVVLKRAINYLREK